MNKFSPAIFKPFMSSITRISASFRDPNGHVYKGQNGEIFRTIALSWQPHYIHLKNSGLLQNLIEDGLLVTTDEIDISQVWPATPPPSACAFALQSQSIPFISYPYEWSFGQLKAAALLTLDLEERALAKQMSLKDASAYNVQFLGGHPIFIDTLSFERYVPNTPWKAYAQFCSHFLAPLSLMAMQDLSLVRLLQVYLDGLPLKLSSRMLPFRSLLSPGLLIHLHLHSAAQERAKRALLSASSNCISSNARAVTLRGRLGILESLKSLISNLNIKTKHTAWSDYSPNTSYSSQSAEFKEKIVREWSKRTQAKMVWDLGANSGFYSEVASEVSEYCVAMDSDPQVVHQMHDRLKNQRKVLPLFMDLANPSPRLGWSQTERDGMLERGPAGLVVALALVHHLAISNNVPLNMIAEFFSRCGEFLIVEFVPKEDFQVQRLLSSREDIFDKYTSQHFTEAFNEFFTIEDQQSFKDNKRILYLMRRRH